VNFPLNINKWDKKPPFTLGEKEVPYGENNTSGPETVPEIHLQVANLSLKITVHLIH